VTQFDLVRVGIAKRYGWLVERVGECGENLIKRGRGEHAWTNFQQCGPILPAPSGSLESRLHGLGQLNVFLDMAPRGWTKAILSDVSPQTTATETA
jgi:hypothetical protein